MAFTKVLETTALPLGSKKAVQLGETEILLVHAEGTDGVARVVAVESKCPHAGAPLEQGALCEGKLICPWHTGTFALPSGQWLEPPPLRSLKTYAVQVEDGSILVDPESATTPTLARDAHTPAGGPADARHFVMIGAGAASATAVCTLRQEGFAGRITLVDPARQEPVDRTNLSKNAMAGKSPLSALPLWNPEELAALKVEQVASRATDLDPMLQTVTLANNATLPFDAALLATGGEPVKLKIVGEDLPHVHTLRHVADLEAILAQLPEEEAARQAFRVVLIGDSFIAFEVASALTQRGVRVTVAARSEAPFAGKWGAEPAEVLVGLHQQNGVTVLTGAQALAITAKVVVLKIGKAKPDVAQGIPADLVLVAIGVTPQTQFTAALPRSERRGKQLVRVGSDLKAAPAVWAAGDMTEVDGTHIEHWRVAQQHGRAAALGMLGQTVEPGTPFFWTAHFGKRFGYAGHAEEWDELVIEGDLAKPAFLAYYVKDNKVAAVLACGRDTALAMLESRLAQGLTLDEAQAAAAAA